jgi:hypothetical protein
MPTGQSKWGDPGRPATRNFRNWQRIRLRLGGSTDSSAPFPAKPLGRCNAAEAGSPNVRRSTAKGQMNEIDRVPVSRTARRRTMDDADLLRNHATRLFALAEKARQKGHPDYADELTSLAREVVRHAVMIERRFRTHAA